MTAARLEQYAAAVQRQTGLRVAFDPQPGALLEDLAALARRCPRGGHFLVTPAMLARIAADTWLGVCAAARRLGHDGPTLTDHRATTLALARQGQLILFGRRVYLHDGLDSTGEASEPTIPHSGDG